MYVIEEEGAEFCKIGISDTPGYRLAGLQTAHWRELSLHSVLWVYHGHALKVEAACHFSAKQRGVEVRREWVKLPSSEAMLLVLEVAAVLGVEACGYDGIEAAMQDENKARAQVRKRMKIDAAQARATALGY